MHNTLFQTVHCSAIKTLVLTFCAFNVHALPIITISYHELYDNPQALDQKLTQAARQGFFYLEMSPEYKQLIPHAVHFGNTFYKDDYYRNLQLPGYSGYKDRQTAQAEGFYCRETLWNEVYAPSITQLARGMKHDAEHIFSRLLAVLMPNTDQATLERITGGLLSGNGLYHLSYKHYRPEMEIVGLPPHRDFGYVTVLYIDKPGLHAKIDGTWYPIPPRENHFIVNFGKAFELLINDPERLKASWHYVEQITHEKHGGDRMCFALFSDNNLEYPLYQMAKDGTEHVLYATYKEYVDISFKETYVQHDLSDIQ